jgi:ferritin-like metal-binding protein YciE
MKLKTLEDLYMDELKDLYSAERQVLKALPKLTRAATSSDLKNAFSTHFRETELHAQRIEAIFEDHAVHPKSKKCVGMQGVLEEGEELLEEKAEADVLDAGLIGAAQRVEHYEMAAYGTARTHAEQLGYRHDVELLQQTLDEEKAADKKLTQIAEASVNAKATTEEGDGRYIEKMSTH